EPDRGPGAVADLFAAGQLRRTDAGASIGRDAGRSAAGRAPHRVTADVPPVRARAASAQGGGAGGGTAAAGGYDQGQGGYGERGALTVGPRAAGPGSAARECRFQ